MNITDAPSANKMRQHKEKTDYWPKFIHWSLWDKYSGSNFSQILKTAITEIGIELTKDNP